MTIKECYEKMGGDYDAIMNLLQRESRIKAYLVKFSEDQSMNGLSEALELKQYDDAFRYVHTLKGICLNLGMTTLANSSSILTEALRAGETSVNDMYNQVKKDYDQTIEAIEALLESKE